MSETYKVEGIGPTPQKAEEAFEKDKTRLLTKLNLTSTNLPEPTNIKYSTTHVVKAKYAESVFCTSFTVQSAKDWEHLHSESTKRANGDDLAKYDSTYTIERMYPLSKGQINTATERSAKSTPSGRDNIQKENFLVKSLKQ